MKQASPLKVLLVFVALVALAVGALVVCIRFATVKEEGVVQSYVDAVHSGRFESAHKLMLHPERESKAEFERRAQQQVFRQTRQVAFVGFSKETNGPDGRTCLNVEADGKVYHFELEGRMGIWKIQVAGEPGGCPDL